MSAKGKKVAIFLEKLYEDNEFWYPRFRLKEAGAEVVAIAPKKDTYPSKHGAPAEADLAIDAVDTSEFDALIIPGGYSPDHMRRNKEMVEFVRKMNDQGKPIAAICHGGWMLASAEVVKGRQVTSWHSIKDDLTHAGAEWIDQGCVKSENIITSRMPDDLPMFCQAILEALD